MSNKKRGTFPIWASVFTAIAFLILIGLGTWQIQRLQWKSGIIAALDEVYAGDYRPLTADDFARAANDKALFLKGRIAGTYLHDKEVTVGPRTREGTAGYHVITPFRLEESGYILVNRGWVPVENKLPSTRSDGQARGVVTVSGIARPPPRGNRFTPENNPEDGAWYITDIDDMHIYTGLKNIIPYIFYASGQVGHTTALPLAHDATWYPPNNHRQYALFWYGMALILLVFYYLRFFRKNGP